PVERARTARSVCSPPSGVDRRFAMSDLNVVSYRPKPEEFAWTFGGVAPIGKVKPGDVLELRTEDAFGGKVRGPHDVVSKVIEFPFVNRSEERRVGKEWRLRWARCLWRESR